MEGYECADEHFFMLKRQNAPKAQKNLPHFEDIPQKFSLEQREMTEFLTK